MKIKDISIELYFFKPSGEFEHQDKQMMTRFEDEEWGVQSGEPVLNVFDTEYGKIGVSICFDVEFPQFAKELCARDVKILLAPSLYRDVERTP